ncbi:MAG: hypothetical protein FWF92_05765 [Oscillospiraceae bacterium]|nr:hypothetical protein [Oscillospiraceae bacterium]
MKIYKISNQEASYILVTPEDERSSNYYLFIPDQNLIKRIDNALEFIISNKFIYKKTELSVIPAEHHEKLNILLKGM